MPGAKYELHRDSGTRGLGVKVEPTATKTFFWARKASGRLFWKTIGEFPAIPLDSARERASRYNSDLARWKADGCVGESPWSATPEVTLGEIVDAYIARHIRLNSKKPDAAAKNTAKTVESQAGRLRDRKLTQIVRSDVVKLKDDVRDNHGPYASNRLLQTLKAAVNWAIRDGAWTGANPFAGIQLAHEAKRKRFLNGEELARLRDALADPKLNRDARDIVHLLLFSGARKADVMAMAWANVDFERRTFFIPDPKNREPRHAVLSTEAVKILRERHDAARRYAEETGLEMSKFVFPSYGGAGHVVDPRNSWDTIRQAAGISNFRLHDLRHTMASWAAMGGASLLVLGAAIGHADVGSTQRYAHLDVDPVRALVQSTQDAMVAAMRKRPRPALLPAPKKKTRRAR